MNFKPNRDHAPIKGYLRYCRQKPISTSNPNISEEIFLKEAKLLAKLD